MPIQSPPYMGVEEKRRYSRTLSLPEESLERRVLVDFFEWWALSVGFELEGSDLDWDSEALACRVKLSELLYQLLSLCVPVFEALNMKRPAIPLAEATRHVAGALPELREAINEAAPNGSHELVAIVDRTKAMMARMSEMLDKKLSRTAEPARSIGRGQPD